MKRSRHLQLALMSISPFMLSACGEEQQNALIYPSVDACIKDQVLTSEQCQKEYANAQLEHEKSAPRFSSANECINEFGAGQCYQPSGSNYFLPLLAGYMIAKASGPRSYYGSAQPMYRSRYEPTTWRTPSGYRVNPNQNQSQPTAALPRSGLSSASLYRGGFGSHAAARSSWGS